jgi:DNA modification methylase
MPVGYRRIPGSITRPEFFRVLRVDSACILWCRWDCFDLHATSLKAAGFKIKNCIVWGKAYHTAGDLDGNLGNQHETAVFAVKGRWKRHGSRDTNLWIDIPQPFSKSRRIHPTEKPVALLKRCVELACPRDGLVFDGFAGSGSTLVACQKTGRRCLGIEIDERYISSIERRITSAETPLFADMEATS